jgi:hypothetical protein
MDSKVFNLGMSEVSFPHILKPAFDWNWDPPAIQLVDANAPLQEILACDGFLKEYNAETPKLIAHLTQPSVLKELLALMASSATLEIPQLVRRLFFAKPRVLDPIFCGDLSYGESAFRIIDSENPAMTGVVLDIFFLVLQNHIPRTVEILALGPSAFTEALLRKVGHPAVVVGLARVLENDSPPLEYLVWHLFVCLIGRAAVTAVPPRRRADQPLEYPILTTVQRRAAIRAIVLWAKGRKGDRYLADAMAANLLAMADFDPGYFEIARYLSWSEGMVERAKLFFRTAPNARVQAIPLLRGGLTMDELASLIIEVYKCERKDRRLYAELFRLVQIEIEPERRATVGSELPNALAFVWNFCANERDDFGEGEVWIVFLLDLIVLVSGRVDSKSAEWLEFESGVVHQWEEGKCVIWGARFPEAGIDREFIERVAGAFAG